ncbi:MAG: 6-bladed beta-propeller [bacterium]|nr:6-bladed beta-propeller [bacterium]
MLFHRFSLILFISLLLGACAGSPVKRRYFWPPLPDIPRVEYIGSYRTITDFPKTKESDIVLESIFGTEDSKFLFIKPWGIASDAKGHTYITDAPRASIFIFDMMKKTVSVVEKVGSPYGIVIDREGRLFTSSGKHKMILVYDAAGSPLWSFGEGIIKGPAGMAINEELGLLYVADTKAHDIKVFNLSGDFLFAIGKRGSGKGEFNFPTDIDITSKGDLVIADSMNARVQVLDSEGAFIRSFGQRGMGINRFQVMKGIAVDSEDHIYVVDTMGSHIKIFTMEGDLLLVIGGPYSGIAPGGFNLPMDIDIDDNDTIFITDQQNRAFHQFQYMNEKYLESHPVK